jgi:hypothetical protein
MANNLFDSVHHIFQRYVQTEPHNHVVFALWALHTHVYRQFDTTPRLSLQSPTPNTGKTTVLRILRQLTSRPEFLIDPTAATLFRLTAEDTTLLLDEMDNTKIDRGLLGILNHGHQKGGTVPRVIKNQVVRWPVFTPVALASIGPLPPVLISRSIVVQMVRAQPNAQIVRLDINNIDQMQFLESINEQIMTWADQMNLNTDPIMPAGREGDKWRVLFSIADSFEIGNLAREAATKFDISQAHVNELLLVDMYKIYERLRAKGIPSHVLVEKLRELEDCEHDWNEFKGIYPLTQGSLAHVMRAFRIKPQSIWWPEGVPRSQQRSYKGYLRTDLEIIWRRYSIGGTTAQRHKKIITLR